MGSWQTGGSFKLEVCSLVVWGETCFHLSNCQNQECCVHKHWGDSKRLVISQVVWAVLLGPVWECLNTQISYFPAFPLQLFPLQWMCYCSPPTSLKSSFSHLLWLEHHSLSSSITLNVPHTSSPLIPLATSLVQFQHHWLPHSWGHHWLNYQTYRKQLLFRQGNTWWARK